MNPEKSVLSCNMELRQITNARKFSVSQVKKEIISLPTMSRDVNEPTERSHLNQVGKRLKSRKMENFRATLMLITVCALFLIAEFPQFILNILSVLNHNFYEEVYIKLGEFLDIIVLINGTINFILYCTMSKSFRDTFCAQLNFFK